MNNSQHSSVNTFDMQETTLLLCTKCKKHIPSIELKQLKGSIVTDINCKYCKQQYIVDLEEYLSLIKQQDLTKYYCGNKPDHSETISVNYCVTCARWLCQECILDHQTYSQLSLHPITNKEVIIEYQCLSHKDEEYESYCDNCNIPLCNKCNEDHKIKAHLITTKESLLNAIQDFNIEESMKYFDVIINQNEEKFNSLLETQNEPLTNLSKDFVSAYETNKNYNKLIYEFIQITFANHQKFSNHPSLELINNIKHMLIPNTIEDKTDDEQIENNCKDLIDYWKVNYIIKIMTKIIYPSGESYDGECVNGFKQGYGKYKWTDGRQYRGFFKDDKQNGKGIMTYPSGDSYDGEYVNDNMEGYGTFKCADSSQYQGHWKNNEPNGKGIMTYPSGASYDGEYVNGSIEGYGTYKCADGKHYRGHFQDNKQNGKGIITYPSGDLYEGTWVNDSKQGYGTYKYVDGRQYQGNFKHDKRNGKGIMTYPDGASYDGEWSNDKMEGIGTYKWKDGKQYQGDWKNDLQKGKGKMDWPSGASYDGEWLNGVFEGNGAYKWPSGKQYQGRFKNGKPYKD